MGTPQHCTRRTLLFDHDADDVVNRASKFSIGFVGELCNSALSTFDIDSVIFGEVPWELKDEIRNFKLCLAKFY